MAVEGLETLRFGDVEVAFDAAVLRPRPWTLAQSGWAEELMVTAPSGRVLELCCGAGQIGLASVLRNQRTLVCVYADATAVQYCMANARTAGLQDRVEVRLGPLNAAVGDGEQYAVVIADPPWVRAADTVVFPEDPLLAIDGGRRGSMSPGRACRSLRAICCLEAAA